MEVRRPAYGVLLRAATLVATLGLGSCRSPHLPVGIKAPPIQAEWLQGEPVDPGTANTLVVVDMFATWCGPCMASMDDLDALQRRYADHGVRVVALAVRDGRQQVERFVAERGRDHGYTIAFDASGAAFAAWRSNALPTSYIVGRSGVVEAVTLPVGLDWEVAMALLGRTHERGRNIRFFDAARTAREAKDWAELERLADASLRNDGDSFYAWVAKVEAQREAAASAAAARAALGAFADDAFSLAGIVHGLARHGRLLTVGAEANAAMQRARCAVPSLHVRSARVLAAHAAGGEALAFVEAALRDELRDQPVETLALVSLLARNMPWLASEPPHAEQADPQPLHAFRVRLLDIAAEDLPASRIDQELLDALLAANASEARVTEVGLRLVARHASDADELNSLTWWLLRDGEPQPVAVRTVTAAVAAMTAIPGWETPGRLDTIALARFVADDLDEAIRLQERAIAMLPSPQASYLRRLERYRGALDQRATR